MSAHVLFGPPPDTPAIMLDDPDEHDFPAAARIISGLTPEQAVTAPPGLPYSVAKILAHMHSNVRFNIGLIRATDPRTFKEKFVNWPEVPSQEWSGLVEAFLRPARSQQIARETDLQRVLYPATKGQPAWTVGYKLVASVAKHKAYHFGQIVALRQLIGAWRGASESENL